MAKSNDNKKIQLSKQERKALNCLIADTTYAAVENGLSDDIIQYLMEIITASYITGVLTVRNEMQESFKKQRQTK